jgi:hypothetical protein
MSVRRERWCFDKSACGGDQLRRCKCRVRIRTGGAINGGRSAGSGRCTGEEQFQTVHGDAWRIVQVRIVDRRQPRSTVGIAHKRRALPVGDHLFGAPSFSERPGANNRHHAPWRASQVDRLLVFRSVRNREVSPATSKDGFTVFRKTSNDPRYSRRPGKQMRSTDSFPQRAFRNLLLEHFVIRIRDLLHHSLARE